MKNNEKKGKILFLDMDGTLLTDKKEFTDRNRKAIEKGLNKGHQIVISTGRPLASALALAKDLKLLCHGCFIISYNGGEIYDISKKKSIYKKTIPIPYVRYIFDQAKAMGLHCQTYNPVEILAEQDTPDLQQYMKLTKMTARIVPDVTKEMTEEPVKIIVMDMKNHDKLETFKSCTNLWCEGKLDRVFSNPQYLEHVACGISKGDALLRLCEYLHLPLSATISVGDAQNDISMLKTAAIGVAMANASDEVKEIADYITLYTNNEDGVAEVIEKFLFSERDSSTPSAYLLRDARQLC